MKHIEFIKAISEYYGEYSSKLVERMTFEYIQDRFKESDLENVFKTIIIKVNPKFKTPPSPADFEDFFPRVNLESEAHKWYDRLNNTGNALDNIIVSDIRAQKALDVFGGWIGFCSRKPDNEIWDRKNFIEAYLKVIPTDEQPSIQYGESSRKHEKTAIMFGDKEKCLEIVNNKQQMIDTDIFKKVE